MPARKLLVLKPVQKTPKYFPKRARLMAQAETSARLGTLEFFDWDPLLAKRLLNALMFALLRKPGAKTGEIIKMKKNSQTSQPVKENLRIQAGNQIPSFFEKRRDPDRKNKLKWCQKAQNGQKILPAPGILPEWKTRSPEKMTCTASFLVWNPKFLSTSPWKENRQV